MNPAIVPLAPGESPTEPGYYLIQGETRQHIVMYDGDAMIRVWHPAGQTQSERIGGFTFIARIYPDRIEGRER